MIIIVAAANTSKINIIIVTVIVYERLNFIYFPILLRALIVYRLQKTRFGVIDNATDDNATVPRLLLVLISIFKD